MRISFDVRLLNSRSLALSVPSGEARLAENCHIRRGVRSRGETRVAASVESNWGLLTIGAPVLKEIKDLLLG
jgi:hypothetical protein